MELTCASIHSMLARPPVLKGLVVSGPGAGKNFPVEFRAGASLSILSQVHRPGAVIEEHISAVLLEPRLDVVLAHNKFRLRPQLQRIRAPGIPVQTEGRLLNGSRIDVINQFRLADQARAIKDLRFFDIIDIDDAPIGIIIISRPEAGPGYRTRETGLAFFGSVQFSVVVVHVHDDRSADMAQISPLQMVSLAVSLIFRIAGQENRQ